MRFALINPQWEFTGSTYFGCQEPHLPLELLFAQQQLERAGHDALLVDAHVEGLSLRDTRTRVRAFVPDFVVLTTAPSYLFWRCPQPELRIPAEWMRGLAERGTTRVAIGPHGSATPAATMRKLDCEVVLRGEPDQILPRLVDTPWKAIEGCCFRVAGGFHAAPGAAQTDMMALGALDLRRYPLARRRHRHHVFSGEGHGAELEFCRGCPWACTFCNKTLFRNRFRERRPADVLAEVEALAARGIDYIYFIDEIFGCSKRTRELLDGLATLPVRFGMQTRIDLWDEASLEMLGRAHCISMECGIESITTAGRERFRKGCRLETGRIAELLRYARRHVAWVQANLIAGEGDDGGAIEAWRRELIAQGVWVSAPVPVFAFPGTPLYQRLFGVPDDEAWERAHAHYLAENRRFSDVQSAAPRPLEELEAA